MKRVAIVQSNYIPWKGYFDLIAAVDEFVLYDDVQYTRRDWRNRNKIKTPQGLRWLTIPVEVKGKYNQKICETRVSDASWAESHWRILAHTYRKAAHFADYARRLETLYCTMREPFLSRINRIFLEEICQMLGIRTRISWSMDYPVCEGRTERLVGICKASGADHYLSGPSAKDYIERDLFTEAGITLEYMDYSGYSGYSQLWDGFEHGVTILDLLFNTGAEAPRYLKYVR
jgi:WbqC-like protein family